MRKYLSTPEECRGACLSLLRMGESCRGFQFCSGGSCTQGNGGQGYINTCEVVSDTLTRSLLLQHFPCFAVPAGTAAVAVDHSYGGNEVLGWSLSCGTSLWFFLSSLPQIWLMLIAAIFRFARNC